MTMGENMTWLDPTETPKAWNAAWGALKEHFGDYACDDGYGNAWQYMGSVGRDRRLVSQFRHRDLPRWLGEGPNRRGTVNRVYWEYAHEQGNG